MNLPRKKLIEVALPLEALRLGPDFGVTSVNYDLGDLLARAQQPT